MLIRPNLLLAAGVVVLTVTSGIVAEQASAYVEKQDRDDRLIKEPDVAIIQGTNIAAPVGRFLLIRKGTEVCALSFRDFQRGEPPLLHRWFGASDDEEALTAKYDWYFQSDGGGSFVTGTISSGTGTVSRGFVIGVAKLSFETRDLLVHCGSFDLNWDFPDFVAFFSGSWPKDQGFEIAVSNWRKISDIRANDPSLTWYRFGHANWPQKIPSADLPR